MAVTAKSLCIVVTMAIMGHLASLPVFIAKPATSRLSVYVMNSVVYPFDVKNDIMVISQKNDSLSSISIRRRGSDGMYNEIGLISDHYDYAAQTNGEWIAITESQTPPNSFYIYKLENDVPVHKQTIRSNFYDRASFFPGNVLVGERPGYLGIYAYNGTAWDFIEDFSLGDQQVSTYGQSISQDGKFVVTQNETYINIYEFIQTGPTFNLIDSLEMDSTPILISRYNGIDTLAFTSGDDVGSKSIYGAVQFYSRSNNGAWIPGQKITAQDIGLRGLAFMGYTGNFVDENTLVVSALAENSVALSEGDLGPAGVVVVFRRNVTSGSWRASYLLNSTEEVFFGMNAFMNEHRELMVAGFAANVTTSGFIFSSCLTTPINVTCHDVQLNDCTNISSSIETLYTINNAECGSVVAHPNLITDQNNVIVEFIFDKFGITATCNSTVQCPAPPITAAPVLNPVKPPTVKVSSGSTFSVSVSLLLLLHALI